MKKPITRTYFLLPITAVAVTVAAGLIGQNAPPDAPAGFATPPLTPNAPPQSVSNGMPEPAGDTFIMDQAKFEMVHDATNGLGPVFNATSCAQCHQNSVTGAASQMTELRIGHLDSSGNFVNPTIPINEGANSVTGRSIVDDRALCEQAQEHVPDSETITARRAVLSILGDGFVEAVDDQTLLMIAANQPTISNGHIHGEAIQIPVLESPGSNMVGRFGWKDQQPTVLSFAADAYLNEMGVTNRIRRTDVTTVCKVTTDVEDTTDSLGLANIDHFAQFIRDTQTPPRDTVLAATPDAQAGSQLFDQIGCSICHVSSMVTLPSGTTINGDTYKSPTPLGTKPFIRTVTSCSTTSARATVSIRPVPRTRCTSCAPCRFGDSISSHATCTTLSRSLCPTPSSDTAEKPNKLPIAFTA